jgi:hypothetical protein
MPGCLWVFYYPKLAIGALEIHAVCRYLPLTFGSCIFRPNMTATTPSPNPNTL